MAFKVCSYMLIFYCLFKVKCVLIEVTDWDRIKTVVYVFKANNLNVKN